MEAELHCPICLGYFQEPVVLQCAHHLCQAHVVDLAGGGGKLVCPVCREVSHLGEEGLPVDRTLRNIAQLWQRQTEGAAAAGSGETPTCGFCEEQLAVKHCQQCRGNLCQACIESSHSKGFFKKHDLVELEGTSRNLDGSVDHCDAHPEEKLNFYCLDCRMPVCSHCLILGEHQKHQQTQISDAFETGQTTLRAWDEKLCQRRSAVIELLEQLESAQVEVGTLAEQQRGLINQGMDHLMELIEAKRTQLLSKSSMEEKQKHQHLQQQIDLAVRTRGDIDRLHARTADLLALRNEHAFLVVCLPLIQDMKVCNSQTIDAGPTVSMAFRPLLTDDQARSLGELDLGVPKRQAEFLRQVMPMAQTSMVVGAGPAGMLTQPGPLMVGGLDSTATASPPAPVSQAMPRCDSFMQSSQGLHGQQQVLQSVSVQGAQPLQSVGVQQQGVCATISFVPQQVQGVQGVQYVYRNVQ